jgi:hypothetical protein
LRLSPADADNQLRKCCGFVMVAWALLLMEVEMNPTVWNQEADPHFALRLLQSNVLGLPSAPLYRWRSILCAADKNPPITNFTSAYLGCQCGTRRSRHALVRGHLTTVTWFSEFLPPPALLKTANRMLLFDKTYLSFLTQTLEEGKVSDM